MTTVITSGTICQIPQVVMFTLPPLPPKDYVLRDVNQNQRSSQEFTPVALPRITQSNLAKFCAPLQYQENERLASLDFDRAVNPQVLEKWTDRDRAFWVDKPGKNDYFLHDIFKNYSVEVVPSYNDKFKHNERVFYRSFTYELECLEEQRLKELRRKMEREESEEVKIAEERDRNTENLGVKSCKAVVPFWWKEGCGVKEEKTEAGTSSRKKPSELLGCDVTALRWHDEPSLTESTRDPCRRRREMALVGQCFRSEACNWYYRHFPPPKIRFIHKKFTK